MGLSFRIPLCAAALLACSVAPGSAALISNFGTFSGTGTTTYSNTVPAGSFADYYGFSADPNMDLTISITNTYTKTGASKNQNIAGLELSLYSGTYNGSLAHGGGTLVDSVDTSVTASTSKNGNVTFTNYGALEDILGTENNYYFEVAADPGAKAMASYSGTISYSVSSVPLPASLPMLAGGLLALAGFGHVASRRRTSRGQAA